MIAIIDYGMGNLRSVQKAQERVGYSSLITADPKQVLTARGVVLPGVGAFADAMANLKRAGFLEVIKQVVAAGKPFLGICLGMQLLFSESEENGLHTGLNIFAGKVARFQLPDGFKIPHMGWNQLQMVRECPLLANIPDGAYFYFVHSYYVVPDDPDLLEAVTDYGGSFPAVVGKDRVFGIQFHPEKSSELGLGILKNFGGLVYSDCNSGD